MSPVFKNPFSTSACMAASSNVVLRMVATSVNISHRAGQIIRDVMNRGDLGTVEKVSWIMLYVYIEL